MESSIRAPRDRIVARNTHDPFFPMLPLILRFQPEAVKPSLRPHADQVRHARHHRVRVLAANISASTHPRDDATGG